ncbi:MAG TPA: tetratricopeptide repeat protein [Blastocatellia bacterium]|nr:tetratricopeptide repeat protein [Blastocatellia bacterium]
MLRIILLALFSLAAFASSSAQGPAGRQGDVKQAAVAAFEQGQNAQERGDSNTAIRYYTQAITSDPALFQAYYQRAVALISLNRDAEAESDLRKVIELDPSFARAHRALGQILSDRGQTADAVKAFRRAVELDPKLTRVRIFYASALLKGGDAAAASEQLKAAIEMGEADAFTHALLGVALDRMGRRDEALAEFGRALALDPNNATAREGRGRLFEIKGDIARATEDYSAAYRAQPSRELALKVAHLHSQAGRHQAAIQIYRGLLREKPEDLATRIELARAMSENNQGDEALKEVEPLLSARPDDPALLALAGDLNFKDNPGAAVGFYRRAVELNPKDNRARTQLGASYLRSMQYEAALPVLQEAIRQEPDNYPAHASLATALFKLNRHAPAAREFIWVIKVRPDIAASYYFLAISFDKLGDCEQAVRAYQEFIRRADPSSNKGELEEAGVRVGTLQRLMKEKKCASPKKSGKGNGDE